MISVERFDDLSDPPDGIILENVWGEFLRITTTPPIEPPAPFILGIDPGDRNGIDDEDINTAWRVVGGEVVEKLQAGKGDPHIMPITIQGSSFSDWYVGFEETTSLGDWELFD